MIGREGSILDRPQDIGCLVRMRSRTASRHADRASGDRVLHLIEAEIAQ
jgi:hypothetical protein